MCGFQDEGFLCLGSDSEIWFLPAIHVMCVWLRTFRYGNCVGSDFELRCIFMGFSCNISENLNGLFIPRLDEVPLVGLPLNGLDSKP